MEIQEIKRNLSIAEVLNHYNLKANKNNLLKCPFHADKTASLQLYPKTNTYNCFSCGANGDTIQFIQDYEKTTKHEALKKATSIINPSGIKLINSSTNKPINTLTMDEQSKIEVLTKAWNYFTSGTGSSKPFNEYLKSRKLNPDTKEIGLNNGVFFRNQTESYKQSAMKYGLLLPDKANGHKVFARNSLVFALRNKQNQIVSFYYRSIISPPSGGDANGRGGGHYYLKDRQGLYPHYPKPETKTIIIPESIIDTATLLQIPEITSNYSLLASYGTNGLTQEHKEAIKELKELEEIILFFDGDNAGKAGAEARAKELHSILNVSPSGGNAQRAKGVKISIVNCPENEDINSLSIGHEPSIFSYLISTRTILFSIEKEKPTTNNSEINNSKANIKESPQISTESTIEIVNRKSQILNTSNPEYITYQSPDLFMSILGGLNMFQLDRLRITLKITYLHNSIRHSLDLYNDDQTEKYIRRASEKLEISTSILTKTISKLTDELEQYRLQTLEKQKKQQIKRRELSPERIQKATNFLKTNNLLQKTNELIGKTGITGEETNRLLMYLIFTSRLREKPLHIITLGTSAAGKTHLQENISELIPEHDKLEITGLSDNAFYYFGRKELKHKLVILEDLQGAENVMYAIRELQSKKRINKTVVMKDSKGNNRTISLEVEGPVCLSATTTMEKLYEDNANRCILIYRDESKEHQSQVMQNQRLQSAGKINNKEQENIKELFKDIQSILKPISVRNPYAEQLQIPIECFKPLRTNEHYLLFIETITFYHQYQRQHKTDTETGETYIETTIEDIENANKLIKDVLLNKSDELTGGIRKFFENLKTWLKQEKKESFYTKAVREHLRMNPSNLKYYITELRKYGLIKSVGGNRYKQGTEYEITNYEEYNNLNDKINTILDNVLENIKKKKGEDKRITEDNNINYPLNGFKNNKLEPVDNEN